MLLICGNYPSKSNGLSGDQRDNDLVDYLNFVCLVFQFSFQVCFKYFDIC